MTAEAQSIEEFRQQLLADGVISGPGATFIPLAGGVSSDIYRVEDAGSVFVVKRALSQLRVEATWHADVRRNRFEIACLNRIRRIAPMNVPEVIHHNAEQGYFTMQCLGPEFQNWKAMMLEGRCDFRHASIAGSLLGRIHRETWNDAELQAEFETTDNFHALRLEPYLHAMAGRHPELREPILAESERIRNSRQCLVHGDFSPKNLLFQDDQIMVLDCEVAWFGDAAFDVAFLLNHLVLKALHLPAQRGQCLKMARTAWDSHQIEAGKMEIDPDVATLLPMLMLARIDGKSPVEYLKPDDRSAVREFATDCIVNPSENLIDLLGRWQVFLNAHEDC